MPTSSSKRWLAIAIGVVVATAIYLGLHARAGDPTPHASPSREPPHAPVPSAPALAVLPATPEPVAPAQPPSADNNVLRAPEGHEPRRKAAVPARKSAGNFELRTIDGFSIVHLGSGAPTMKPFGANTVRTRTITGKVIDRAGNPVANALVFADRSFTIRRDDMMTIGSGVTDAAGAFTLAVPVGEAYALALAGDDWSDIVQARDNPIELRVLGHGGLDGRFTHDGEPETFKLYATKQAAPVAGTWETGTDGTISIPSLPPGRYKVSVGLAQSFAGGESRTLERDITIVDGQTAELELAFVSGATLAVTAKLPTGSTANGITFWLFTGSAPRDGADARARKRTENAVSQTLGGSSMTGPAQFHDVVPGTYHACAAVFDAATMEASDRPFGCVKISVSESESVREAEIVLAN